MAELAVNGAVDEIVLKMQELKSICFGYGVPMLCFIAVDDPEAGKTEYKSEAVTPLEAGVELKDDRITRLSAALSGNFELHVKNDLGKYTNELVADAFAEAIDDDDDDCDDWEE